MINISGEFAQEIPMEKKTLGERRVRVDFNPAGSDFVKYIKQETATLIDEVDRSACKPSFTDEEVADFNRWKSLAITKYEEAAMYAVKALTI